MHFAKEGTTAKIITCQKYFTTWIKYSILTVLIWIQFNKTKPCHVLSEGKSTKSVSLAIFHSSYCKQIPWKSRKQQWMDIVCVACSSVAWPLLLPKHYKNHTI